MTDNNSNNNNNNNSKDGDDNKNKNKNDNNNNLVKNAKKMILVDEKEPVDELPPPFPPRNFEVNEEDDVRDYYHLKKEIGRGRFGTVYLVEDKKTGQKFAAKFVNTKRNQDRANVEREVEIMKLLNSERPHPRLIQLYDAFDMAKEMCLVLEIVDGGELFERVINDDFLLTERACTVFVRQICEGVEFIHSKNILHLDMKPENILCLSREGNRVKICDFGLARRYDPRKKLQVLFGTPEFVAPEVVNFEPIGFGTDMWSVGVICYVLLSGLSPFMGHNYVETMTNVTHNKYDFEDEAFDCVSEDAKEFIQQLLVLDKSMRLTPAQCLRHNWLRTPPPAKTLHLHRHFSTGSSSEDDEEDDDEEDDDEEDDDDEEEEIEPEPKVVQKVDLQIKPDEEETEKYSVRRRRRKEEEEKEKKKKEQEQEEEKKRKDMEVKRKELERQIEEQRKRILVDEERMKKKKEEDEIKRKELEEERRKKKEEEEARRKKEEERRRNKVEEETRRKEEEREAKRRKRAEEEARRKEEEAKRKKKEEEEAARRREQEAERKRKKEEEKRAEEEKRKKEEEQRRKEAEEKRRKETDEKRRKEIEEEKMREVEMKRREINERERRRIEERKEEEKQKIKERKKMERLARGGLTEAQLVRSKAQLKEFVARWNSHPNSPYVLEVENTSVDLGQARGCSGSSISSLVALAPSDTSHDLNDHDDDDDEGAPDEEFIHYTISAPLRTPASDKLNAGKMQVQATACKEDGKSTSGKYNKKSSGRGDKRSSSARSSHSRLLSESEEAENIIREILKVDHRSAYEEYKRMVGCVGGSSETLRRPEVKALQKEDETPRRGRGSRSSSRNRKSRRQMSREGLRDDRPPSRDGDRSPVPAHRRPSRDVPLSSCQMERLARIAGGGEEAPMAWPDLIVAPRDEADEEVRQFSLDVPVASLLKSPSGTLRSVPGLKVSPETDTNTSSTPHSGAPSLTPPSSPSPEAKTTASLHPSSELTTLSTLTPSSESTTMTTLTPPASPSSEPNIKESLSAPPPSLSSSSTHSSSSNNKTALTPPPSPVLSLRRSTSPDDPPKRLVEWIMDIGIRSPPRQSSSGSLQDRVSLWEARESCTRALSSRSSQPSSSPRPSPSPRLSPSPSPSRRTSDTQVFEAKEALAPRRPQPPFSAMVSENPSTETTIQTPWGTLKRSPSRTSLKSLPKDNEDAQVEQRKTVTSVDEHETASDCGSPVRLQPLDEWSAGKSQTLPRNAKLLKQKSVANVPATTNNSQPESDGGIKRKGKFPPSPNKRPLAMLLFSTQDRISMFEQQKQKPSETTRGPQRPFNRTRSSVTFGDSSASDPRTSTRSQVTFMKTRLLGRAGPSLPEEPSNSYQTTRPGPDAA